MQIATQSLAGPDHPLAEMLGSAVLIVFSGVLLRALSRLSRDLRRRLRSNGPRTVDLGTTPGPPRRANESDDAPDAPPTTPSRRGDGNPPQPRQAHTRTPPSGKVDRRAPRGRANDRRSSAGAVPAPSGHDLIAMQDPEETRLRASTLEPLARTLERGRQRRAAEQRVARELGALPAGFWLVERDVPLGARRAPFLVAGATGVFVLCATHGGFTPRDMHAIWHVAQAVRGRLPDYDGPVHAALVLAFEPMTPRTWYGGTAEEGRGGWALGISELRPWLSAFGPACGLRNGDVRRLDEAARPRPERRSTPRLPATPKFG